MNDHVETNRIRVGIIGAGIAGCCLAIGLLQNPALDVQLYEGRPNVAVRGAGLVFHGNAIRAMDLISPDIKWVYFKKSHFMAKEEDIEMATKFILASGPHAGTILAELGKAKGRRTVHRAHFIEGLLEESVPSDCLHFDKRLMLIKEDPSADKVIASFSDGTHEAFDVLFGAEGVYSPTRKFILGANHPTANPVNHDEWRQFYCAVPMTEAKKVLPIEAVEQVRNYCLPIGFINGIPVDLGQTLGICCYQRDSNCPIKGAPFNPNLWKGHLPEVDAFISLLEKNAREDWVLQDHDHASTYYKGRVAMIGDAAHATFPHAGNGAAQAIEDCSVLTGLFSHEIQSGDVESALRAFDKIRRPRSQKVIEITRQFGRLYTQDPAGIDLEATMAEMKEGGMYTNGVDLVAQVKNAVDAFEQCRAWDYHSIQI